MSRRLSDTETAGIVIGTLAAIACGALLGSVRGEVSAANASLVLVLVVIVAAYTGGPRAGAATGLMAAVAFDFFLTRPYLSLAIKSTDDIVTAALLVVIGLAVGALAASRQRAQADSRAGHEEIESIVRVSNEIAAGATLPAITQTVEAEVTRILGLGECRFVEHPPLDPPLPELDRTGRIDAPYVFIGDGFTLPADGFTIEVRLRQQILGWMVCQPDADSDGVARDRRLTAIGLVDHLALLLALDQRPDGRPL